MAVDIVPELIDDIRREFEKGLLRDPRFRVIARKIENGTATLADIHGQSVALGELLSDALRQFMRVDMMPDGKIYWNIANRVIKPFLTRNYNLVNSTAEQIQEIVNAAENISIAAVHADFPEERANGLLNLIANDPDNPFKWLGEPIVNITESFSDDYMKANADFRYKAGLEEKIVRSVEHSAVRTSKGRKYDIPCDWCSSLAGVYAYPNTPKEIFQRHEFCRCSVVFESSKGKQDVWSKARWTASDEELQSRRENVAADNKTPAERAREAANLAKQRENERIAKETRITNDLRQKYIAEKVKQGYTEKQAAIEFNVQLHKQREIERRFAKR